MSKSYSETIVVEKFEDVVKNIVDLAARVDLIVPMQSMSIARQQKYNVDTKRYEKTGKWTVSASGYTRDEINDYEDFD